MLPWAKVYARFLDNKSYNIFGYQIQQKLAVCHFEVSCNSRMWNIFCGKSILSQQQLQHEISLQINARRQRTGVWELSPPSIQHHHHLYIIIVNKCNNRIPILPSFKIILFQATRGSGRESANSHWTTRSSCSNWTWWELWPWWGCCRVGELIPWWLISLLDGRVRWERMLAWPRTCRWPCSCW